MLLGTYAFHSSACRYVARHRDALVASPSFLFCVGGDPAEDLGRLAEQTGWLPARTAAVTGAHDLELDTMRAFALAIGDDMPAGEPGSAAGSRRRSAGEVAELPPPGAP